MSNKIDSNDPKPTFVSNPLSPATVKPRDPPITSRLTPGADILEGRTPRNSVSREHEEHSGLAKPSFKSPLHEEVEPALGLSQKAAVLVNDGVEARLNKIINLISNELLNERTKQAARELKNSLSRAWAALGKYCRKSLKNVLDPACAIEDDILEIMSMCAPELLNQALAYLVQPLDQLFKSLKRYVEHQDVEDLKHELKDLCRPNTMDGFMLKKLKWPL